MRREPLPTPPTLGQIRQNYPWGWLYCPRWTCLHRAPMALAPAIIRWGPGTSSDVLRQRTRCSKCGYRGDVTVQTPSWDGPHIRFARFPVAYL